MIQRKINTEFQSQRPLYLEHLMNEMNGRYAQNISDWTQCSNLDDSRYLACSSQWIQEDAELSCGIVYRDENYQQITNVTGFNITELNQTYYNSRMDVVELRLIQAGVRLATVINKIAENNEAVTMPRLSLPLIALISMYIVLLN